MILSDHRACNLVGRLVITEVAMPQMGLEVNEATVLDVLVSVGDVVASEAPLLELETDKATIDVVAPHAGVILALDVEVGQQVSVGERLATVGDASHEQVADVPVTVPPRTVAEATSPEPSTTSDARAASATGTRPKIAPVARRAAETLGVSLRDVTGTGQGGRITLTDVERAAEASGPDGTDQSIGDDVEPLSGIRRTIARRMSESQLIPQYRLERDIDATHLLAQRDSSAAAARARARPGINDLLIQAIAEMVVAHPALATVYVDDATPGLRRHARVNVGLAVATDRGLLVPVIESPNETTLSEIAAARDALVSAARAGSLSLSQMTGATITLSNLGAFGVDRFTAMLNPGESSIVAVGRIVERVVPRGGSLVIVPSLTLTLTFDHRAVDGAVGGAALSELAELLEGAMAWRY